MIRDTIRRYDCLKTYNEQVKAMNPAKKEDLCSTLSFLKTPCLRPKLEDYNKPTLVHHFICRVQNLLPDTCEICKEEYCVSIDDPTLLPCSSCGQEAHRPCILKLLGATSTDIDSESIKGIINPVKIPGLMYLCLCCRTQQLFDQDAGIKVHLSKKEVPPVTKKRRMLECE